MIVLLGIVLEIIPDASLTFLGFSNRKVTVVTYTSEPITFYLHR